MALSFIGADTGFDAAGLAVRLTLPGASGDMVIVTQEDWQTLGDNIDIANVTAAATWVEFNGGNALVQDNQGSPRLGEFLSGYTLDRGSGGTIDVDATPNSNYNVCGAFAFRDAGTPYVGGATSRANESNNDNIQIPAFTVNNNGSIAFLTVTGYNSTVGTTPFTSNGWTLVASNDDGGASTSWTRHFTKPVNAGTYTKFGTSETDTESWMAVVHVIPPNITTTVEVNPLTTGSAASASGTTASITPTAGAVLYAALLLDHGDGLDPASFTADFSITGLSGTWNEVAAEMIFPRNIHTVDGAIALFECRDWSGSGTLGVSFDGGGTVNNLTWLVLEATGVSDQVPMVGLTRSVTGSLYQATADQTNLTIGSDNNEQPPVNGASLSFLFAYDTTWGGSPVAGTNYDANWTHVSTVETVDRFITAAWSPLQDATANWYLTSSTESLIEIGFWLVEDGNEPVDHCRQTLAMDESKETDGTNVSALTDWSTYQVITANGGIPQIDTSNQHSVNARVVDMTDTGSTRMRNANQVGNDDHWVSAVWFMDKASAAGNEFWLNLRMQAATASASDSGYGVRFSKATGLSDGSYFIEIFELTSGTATQIATYGATPAVNGNGADSGLNCYAEIKGSVIRVYANGTLMLTHDTTGDTNEYSTGQYTGAQHYRENSTVDSQPFFYRWQAGVFGLSSAVTGVASLGMSISATAAGSKSVDGTAAGAWNLSATAVGTKTVDAIALASGWNISATAVGSEFTLVTATALMSLSASHSAQATKNSPGTGSMVLNTSLIGSASKTGSGVGSAIFTASFVSSASKSVQAVAASGWTITAAAAGTIPGGPAVPINVVATDTSDTTIQVTWDAFVGATGYDIERNGAIIATDHASSPFNDSGLSPSTTYQYRVRAVK